MTLRIPTIASTVLLAAILLPAAPAASQDAAAVAVPFPTAYRSWAHVKSMAIVEDKHPLFAAFGGIHHVYANALARTALQKGAPFPDGSVLVFDLLEAPKADGAHTEGARKFVAAMARDEKKYAATGGWGYQAWGGGDAKTPALAKASDQAGCHQCHMQVAKTGFVYSQWRR